MVSAVAFVTRKSPVAAAMWLVSVMFSLAALYVMLDAQFIGTMQVERTGAIAPLAGPLFHEYLLAFEVTSILLLAAVVGAVVLGKRKERVNAG